MNIWEIQAEEKINLRLHEKYSELWKVVSGHQDLADAIQEGRPVLDADLENVVRLIRLILADRERRHSCGDAS